MIKIPEIFYTSHKLTGRYVEIFKNPSMKEMDDVASSEWSDSGFPELRFIADNITRDVYVFSSDILHYTAREIMGKGIPRNKAIFGIAEKEHGEYWMTEDITLSDDLALDNPRFRGTIISILQQDWYWVNKYIEVNHYIDSLRDALERQEYDDDF